MSAGKGFPGGMPDISKLLGDPDIMGIMQDPQMRSILMEVVSNPSAINKYKDNPKVAKLMEKFSGMM